MSNVESKDNKKNKGEQTVNRADRNLFQEDENNRRKSSIAHARGIKASPWSTTIFLGNEQWRVAQN